MLQKKQTKKPPREPRPPTNQSALFVTVVTKHAQYVFLFSSHNNMKLSS